MSAVPIPRGRTAPAPRRPGPRVLHGGDAEFFGMVPAGPIASKTLPDRAKVALSGLCVLARGSRTWVDASIAEVMAATGHSEKKTRQALRELTAAGLIEWDSLGDKFRVLFRLRGPGEPPGPSAPSPRLAPDPGPVGDQMGSHLETKREPEREVPLVLERERDPDDDKPESSSSSIPSPDPDPEGEPPASELVEAFAGRLLRHFGEACHAEIEADVRAYGEAMVDYAISKCEAMPSPHPAGYRYARGIMRRATEEGKEIRRPAPRPATATMQNYNPGPRYDPVPEAERPDWKNWRQYVPGGGGPARKNTGAGGLSPKTPPAPGREISGVHPGASYDTSSDESRCDGEQPTPHDAPRGSDPDTPPTGGASRETDTPARPPAGGRGTPPGRTGKCVESGPSPGPRAGAHPGPPTASGSLQSRLPCLRGIDSSGPTPRSQRQSGDPPTPHPRE